MKLATNCPFLKKVPSDLLRKTGPSLFNFAEKCPVMSSVIAATNVPLQKSRCPFSTQASPSNNIVQISDSSKKLAQESKSEEKGILENQSLKPKLPWVNQVKSVHTAAIVKEDDGPPELSCPYQVPPSSATPFATKVAPSKSSASFKSSNSYRSEEPTKPKTSPQTAQQYPYSAFFNKAIAKKKEDHSYRVFSKVNRLAKEFPLAHDYTRSATGSVAGSVVEAVEDVEANKVTVWCSNDYLGMSRHPHVTAAAKNAIDTLGVGAGGTRNISGTSLFHGQLENSLADWHEKEAGLLFTSCYVANDTALYTLGNMLPNCIIYSDQGNHASMIHGIRTSNAKKVIYRHNDVAHLEQLLMQADPSAPKIVAFETVHSMSGAVCPLESICDVAHKYGAITFVDEVHAVGLYGKRGAGIGERDGCLEKMDIISGTLGKAVGVIGGYLVGNEQIIDTLRSYGAGFIFTTALPPDKAQAALSSIEILKSQEGLKLRQRHQQSVRQLRRKLLNLGFPLEYSPSHIIPVHMGDPDKCTKVSQYLLQEKKIYIQAINYPTVAKGKEKLRIAPTPFHTESMMDELVVSLTEAWEYAGLPKLRHAHAKEGPFCFAQDISQVLCEQGGINVDMVSYDRFLSGKVSDNCITGKSCDYGCKFCCSRSISSI